MEKNKKPKINYDIESDVLRIEISKKPIDYAKEMGNVVVHFTKEGLPVYLEILEARKFLNKTKQILDKTAVPRLAPKSV